MDQNEAVDLIFLDFAKAFDSVNHRFLRYKLMSYGINRKLVDWIGAFLDQRTFHVKVNDYSSESLAITSGVPQGSFLGPLLFLVFINDLPDILEGKILMFADDVKLIAPRTLYHSTHKNMRSVCKWAEAWDLPG